MNDRNATTITSRTNAGSRQSAQRPASARPTPAARPAATARRPSAARGGWWSVPDHRYSAYKWALLAALIVYAWLVVGANRVRDVDFSSIEARMAAAPGVSALGKKDENAFQDRFGTSPEGCEGWLLYGADEIMNVSELMIAKGSEQALDRLEEAVDGRLKAQLDVFKSYGVDQAGLLEGAVVLRRGDYLFYGVSEEAHAWEDAFLSCIR